MWVARRRNVSDIGSSSDSDDNKEKEDGEFDVSFRLPPAVRGRGVDRDREVGVGERGN